MFPINIKRLLTALFSFILVSVISFGNTTQVVKDTPDVLIINTYRETKPWYLDIGAVHQALEHLSASKHIESLDMTLITTDSLYEKTVQHLFEQYKFDQPEAVILMGGLAATLCDSIYSNWGDIPIVYISVTDKVGEPHDYLTGADKSVDFSQWKDVQSLRNNHNITFIQQPYYEKETIDLMVQTMPDINRIIFISDEKWNNKLADYEISRYVHDKYPHIKYEWMVGNRETSDEISEYLDQPHPRTGILLNSWTYESDSHLGYPVIVNSDMNTMATSPNAIFSLNPVFLEYGSVGGYYYDQTEVSDTIQQILTEVLTGTQARNIPFYYPKKAKGVIDYIRFEETGNNPDNIGPDVFVLNAKPSFYEIYKWPIIIGIILFVGGLLFAIILLRNRAMHLRYTRYLDELITAMPVAFMEINIIRDKKGNILGYRTGRKNELVRNILKANELLDQNDQLILRDVLRVRFEELLAKKDGKPLSFTHTMHRTDDSLEIILDFDHVKKDVINLFGVNITPLVKSEKEQRILIEERKQNIIKLEEALKKAEESDKLKSVFLANMSHEIRTPLNAIVGFSQLLTVTEEPEKKEQFIELIHTNNDVLLQIINDILDLAKVESNTLEFNFETIDVNKLVKNVEETTQLRTKPGVILNSVLGAKECYMNADPKRLQQVLTNLLNNACKFTDQGSITFGYEIHQKEIYFYVKDTGIGIAPENQEEVFKRFSKLNTFTQGNGLGLSISRAIVDKFNGEMGLQSDGLGKGSLFWFTLPFNNELNKSVKAEKKLEKAIEVPPTPSTPKKTEPKIEKKEEKLRSVTKEKPMLLVAEDNPSNYILLETILAPYFNLVHAWNGIQAVDYYRQHRPDLILMDISMPMKDGYQATFDIRKVNKKIPIVAVTAYAFASDKEKILRSGFDSYISKPIDSEKLLHEINTFLN
ncbi:MAG: response regulator [Muribaculaceae bacterium]|nr:response regulator [Muribaculaceae bacterium]